MVITDSSLNLSPGTSYAAVAKDLMEGFEMALETARVPTANGARYLQQLCKHWSHKLDVRLSENEGVVRFPDAAATMKADADALTVSVEAEDDETLQRMKGVVASHLDRFAFCEAPLVFSWSRA
ncbi:MAG TPA: DUF2218 domain-containing protein [Microvirga sp.]|nr:DUF2218 domain-containing protein [Microvirga sp.]